MPLPLSGYVRSQVWPGGRQYYYDFDQHVQEEPDSPPPSRPGSPSYTPLLPWLSQHAHHNRGVQVDFDPSDQYAGDFGRLAENIIARYEDEARQPRPFFVPWYEGETPPASPVLTPIPTWYRDVFLRPDINGGRNGPQETHPGAVAPDADESSLSTGSSASGAYSPRPADYEEDSDEEDARIHVGSDRILQRFIELAGNRALPAPGFPIRDRLAEIEWPLYQELAHFRPPPPDIMSRRDGYTMLRGQNSRSDITAPAPSARDEEEADYPQFVPPRYVRYDLILVLHLVMFWMARELVQNYIRGIIVELNMTAMYGPHWRDAVVCVFMPEGHGVTPGTYHLRPNFNGPDNSYIVVNWIPIEQHGPDGGETWSGFEELDGQELSFASVAEHDAYYGATRRELPDSGGSDADDEKSDGSAEEEETSEESGPDNAAPPGPVRVVDVAYEESEDSLVSEDSVVSDFYDY